MLSYPLTRSLRPTITRFLNFSSPVSPPHHHSFACSSFHPDFWVGMCSADDIECHCVYEIQSETTSEHACLFCVYKLYNKHNNLSEKLN